jgi:hypothetical protein
MQTHQFAGEAEQRTPSWYLARGDKRYGPLADRELLLLAERGGLRTDDLLWKPGFETWKSVHAVCDLGTFPRDTAGQDASHQDAPHRDASAQRAAHQNGLTEDASYLPTSVAAEGPGPADIAEADASQPSKAKPSLKARLYDEFRKFLMIFSYLWLVFFVFLVHEWAILASNHISFRFYGLAVVNALILSKIMLIAEALKFAERLNDKPLVYPIAFKSISFSVLLMVSYVVEEIAVGLFHGKSVSESFPEVGGGGLVGLLTIGGIFCIAFVPFFGFREIARVIGEAEFRALMLGAAKDEQDSKSHQQGIDPLPVGAAS